MRHRTAPGRTRPRQATGGRNGRGVDAMKGWFLVGPTASGKSDVAHVLARRMRLPVLSADAMLVYRGMEIGTAKPTAEEREGIDYAGLDLVDPGRPFSAGAYIRATRRELAAFREAPACIVAGGTGLYIRALTEGLDRAPASPDHRHRSERLFREGGLPALQAELESCAPGRLAELADPRNPRRVARALEQAWAAAPGSEPVEPRRRPRGVLAGIQRAPDDLASRIEERARAMFAGGLLDEVRTLSERPGGWSDTARNGIGYREAREVISGDLSVDEAVRRTAARTRALARRQRTWFRHQAEVTWIEVEPSEGPERIADRVSAMWEQYGSIELHL